MHPAGTRSATRLLASLLALAAVVLAPVGLAWVARRRFGGTPPWTGVDPPWHWDTTAIREALTNRLTESVIVDVIVRVALAAIWVAVGVILVTIVAETIHMVRHGGMTLPSIRGLGWSQRVARFVAAGLIVVLPTSHASRAETHALPVRATTASSAVVAPAQIPSVPAMPERVPAGPGGITYTVQAGDSVYEIAQRLAGADRGQTVAVAEQILDLNLGAVMVDGHRFTNAAYIEPGWVLVLPAGVVAPGVADTSPAPGTADVHVVERGETLWSIAGEEMGAPTRWPEIWELNRGEDMGDGSVLVEPDLIMPGWRLELPTSDATAVAPATVPPLAAPQVAAAPVAVPSVAPAPDVVTVDRIAPPAPPPTFAVPTAPDAPATTTEPPRARRDRFAASGRRSRHDDGSDRRPADVRPRTRGDAVGGGADTGGRAPPPTPPHGWSTGAGSDADATIARHGTCAPHDRCRRTAASRRHRDPRRRQPAQRPRSADPGRDGRRPGCRRDRAERSVPDRRAVLVDRRPLASRRDDDHRIAEPGSAAGGRTVCRTRATRRHAGFP